VGRPRPQPYPHPVLAPTRPPAPPPKVLGDRSLRFKYTNPSVIFAAVSGGTPAAPSVTALLISGDDGAIIHQQAHEGATGPVQVRRLKHGGSGSVTGAAPGRGLPPDRHLAGRSRALLPPCPTPSIAHPACPAAAGPGPAPTHPQPPPGRRVGALGGLHAARHAQRAAAGDGGGDVRRDAAVGGGMAGAWAGPAAQG
jgi:hypothetical protein